jgi:tetratricopeptide (TPR) repeat protein
VDRFNQALQEDDTLSGPYYRLAQYALMRDKKKQARTYLLSELKLGPENGDTLVSIASMFLTIGEGCHTQQNVFGDTDFDHATHCLLRAVDLDSADADAHYYLGLISALRGRLEDAAEFFAHALDINTKHIAALRDSAFVYLAMGKFADAANRISKARALASDDSQVRTLARRIRLAHAIERIGLFARRFSPPSILKKLFR